MGRDEIETCRLGPTTLRYRGLSSGRQGRSKPSPAFPTTLSSLTSSDLKIPQISHGCQR